MRRLFFACSLLLLFAHHGTSQGIQDDSTDQQTYSGPGEDYAAVPRPEHVGIRSLSFGSMARAPDLALPLSAQAGDVFHMRESQQETEARRSMQNLEAQQRSAFWTMVTGMAAIASVFIGIFGLWLVKGTLLATRGALTEAANATSEARLATAAAEKSLELTEETSKRQLRSYLSPLSVAYGRAGGASDGSNGVRIHIKVVLKNTGATPASMCEVRGIHTTIDGRELSRSQHQIWELGSGGEWSLDVISDYPPWDAEGRAGKLLLCVGHTDVFEDRHERDYLYLIVFRQGAGIKVEPFPFIRNSPQLQ